MWIPAFAGMTKGGAGMTKGGAGMTKGGAGMTIEPGDTRMTASPTTLDTGRRRYDGKRSGVVGVVVFVLVSGMLGGVGCDSDAVFEYEVGELVAVDEADVLGSD